jgi:hypothetical protein
MQPLYKTQFYHYLLHTVIICLFLFSLAGSQLIGSDIKHEFANNRRTTGDILEVGNKYTVKRKRLEKIARLYEDTENSKVDVTGMMIDVTQIMDLG